MNLTFDNLLELDAFLSWARRLGVAHAMSQGFAPPSAVPAAAPPDTHYPTLDAGLADNVGVEAEGLAAGRVVFDTPPEVAGKVPEQTAEPAKRKRRTKAEIEADAARIAADATAREVADANRAEHGGEAAEAYKQSEQPEGTNPFEQAAAPAAGSAAPAGDTPVADGDEPEVVTPFQHLTRGREFIAKHGMPKYLETFTKAGTDPNVMGYSAYQRGLHMAAMDELDKA